ncbi:MAG: DUF3775 domain-containing protein [Alphaproteobacteria bacterium]|jgi:hypothetical protein|nr:DUF3775 domain-containing protein [Alphaproteobacteria bacterium]
MDLKPEIPCYIIFKARQLFMAEDVLEAAEDDEGSGVESSNIDEEGLDYEVHEEHERDPIFTDLKNFIDELPADDQCQLIALAWLGRGDGGSDEWQELVNLAQERRSDHTAAYLLNMPLLADHLENALDAFDISCEDFENVSV